MTCLGDCDFRLTEQLNKKLLIADYFAHQIQVNGDAEGEKKDCVRMVLIDTEGKTYECVSETLVKSLQAVIFAYGQPPWKKGIAVEVVKKQKGKFNIFTLKAV